MRPDPIRAAYSANMHEVTRILNAIDQGDPHAAEQLLPLVYKVPIGMATVFFDCDVTPICRRIFFLV